MNSEWKIIWVIVIPEDDERKDRLFSVCESQRNVIFLVSWSSLLFIRECTFRYWGEHDENEPNSILSSGSSVSSPMS